MCDGTAVKKSMSLDIAKRSGMILSSIGKALGVDQTTISSWRTGRHSPKNETQVTSKIGTRAKFLSRIDLDTYDINDLKEDFGITFQSIADELNTITRWGLSEQAKLGFPNEKLKKEVQEVIRSVGRRILKGMD